MVRPKSRRNGNGKRRIARFTRQHVTPKSVVSGRYFTPPNAIRDSSARPWNTYMCVYSLAHTSNVSQTYSDISDQVTLRNGLYVTSESIIDIELRVISLEIYGVTNQSVTCVFYNLTASNTAFEQATQNIPAKNQYARLGYVWPLADQSAIYSSSSSSKIFTLLGTGTESDKALIRMRVLWRSTIGEPLIKDQIPRPEVSRHTALMDQLDKLVSVLNRTTISDHQSSSSSFCELNSPTDVIRDD